MAPEKRNQFLDAEDSDDDAVQDNSEDELQKGGRSAKRRRVEDDSDLDDEEFSDDAGPDAEGSDSEPEDGESNKPQKPDTGKKRREESGSREEDSNTQPDDIRLVKPLLKKNPVATEAAIKKSGVVYISRIPPFMKPHKLRSLLGNYGTINRIFLAPEDPMAHQRRVRNGGNKKKMYTEGWVEFVSKKDAKAVCEMLNAQTIGGKKGSYYRDDIWTLKYLNGFKWHHLTEQIAAENAERSSRMMAELTREKKGNKDFVQRVERAKMLDGIQSKKVQKKGSNDGGAEADALTPAAEATATEKPRKFKQTSLAQKKAAESTQPQKASKALSKVF
ncbi:pre-rrna-processing protein esf2 [Diaporthe amygdali]|uniref:pre-rrna-processing protein esf2 n=1 Tax=Phomopsis amygdali TaxID=1214568 RepID=UPI0022FDB649|nr:pre-rrna-processing protein esf2 [Diaporthe amygdali]KAJ0118688.1 pre-rrna-processing protein esf2 [Diaporthe amygdali]